jgi:hypothetical protein
MGKVGWFTTKQTLGFMFDVSIEVVVSLTNLRKAPANISRFGT